MSLLDPRRSYVLTGESGNSVGAKSQELTDEKPPEILHLKLSTSVLEEIIASQKNGASIQLRSLESGVPVSLTTAETIFSYCID